MQILEIILARTAWFVELAKLNPAGLAYGPMLSGLREKYKFLRYPTSPIDIDLAKGLRFEAGEFEFNRKKIGVGLVVYGNGWAADSLISTEAADAFLEDAATWLTESFGLLPAKNFVSKTTYDSQVVFTSDINLAGISEKLDRINLLVRSASGNPNEQLAGLTFGSGPYPSLTFGIERRTNVEFSEQKYFSKALFPTSKHVDLLKEMERILS